MEKYRTFIGLPVRVDHRFLGARNELIDALDGERISWVDPDLYHLTVRFIGDTEVAAVGPIGKSLLEHVEVPGNNEVHLHRLGSFGPRKRPRVVWVGFEETGIFEMLRKAVDKALEAHGIPPEPQPFRAHLTLGRIRDLNDLQRFHQTIEHMEGRFSQKVFLDRLVFYRSELGNRGPVYTPLMEMKFRDQAL
jgi:2'-5' RNA ligase